ncbi:hypothetical protein CULT_250055 [[Clostridium] ultunense Esp]|nr:hypothetical protein CULT_250055 [[Clostridium] ultunense Esp]
MAIEKNNFNHFPTIRGIFCEKTEHQNHDYLKFLDCFKYCIIRNRCYSRNNQFMTKAATRQAVNIPTYSVILKLLVPILYKAGAIKEANI